MCVYSLHYYIFEIQYLNYSFTLTTAYTYKKICLHVCYKTYIVGACSQTFLGMYRLQKKDYKQGECFIPSIVSEHSQLDKCFHRWCITKENLFDQDVVCSEGKLFEEWDRIHPDLSVGWREGWEIKNLTSHLSIIFFFIGCLKTINWFQRYWNNKLFEIINQFFWKMPDDNYYYLYFNKAL